MVRDEVIIDGLSVKINKDVAEQYLREAEKIVRTLRTKASDCDNKDTLDLTRQFTSLLNNANKMAEMPVKEITYEERMKIFSEIERLEKLHRNVSVSFELNCICMKR